MKRMNLLLRSAVPSDAHDFYTMLVKLDSETVYTPFQPDERCSDIDTYSNYIEQANKKSILIFAIDPQMDHEKIVGFITARRGATIKKNHVATIGIGILKAYQLSGIGRSLLKNCIDQSFKLGVKRLEAYIPISNIKSRNLLNKFNFKLEGTKINSLFIDGQYEDEYVYGLSNIE